MRIEDYLTTLSEILHIYVLRAIKDVLARASTYQFVLRMDSRFPEQVV